MRTTFQKWHGSRREHVVLGSLTTCTLILTHLFFSLRQLILAMADKVDSSAPPERTLRNRRTTVEDADDEDSDTSPVATTTATSISSSASVSTSASTKRGGPSSDLKDSKDDKKKTPAAYTRPRQPQAKSNQLRSLMISLLVASLGVLFKSGYEKFLFPSREIAINQTVGIQGNCHKTACRS